MRQTRENILMAALRLFARGGYEAVSVSAIAGALGMTKGALYRHYRNKREIFDRIVERMVQMDLERARQHEVPEAPFAQSPAAYRQATLANIRRFTLSQFRFWTEDEFGRAFRQMVTLEQYRNPEMADWQHKLFAGGPVSYMEDLFREMMAQGVLRSGQPRMLALDFYAPFYLLISLADAPSDGGNAIAVLAEHIDDFIRRNAVDS